MLFRRTCCDSDEVLGWRRSRQTGISSSRYWAMSPACRQAGWATRTTAAEAQHVAVKSAAISPQLVIIRTVCLKCTYICMLCEYVIKCLYRLNCLYYNIKKQKHKLKFSWVQTTSAKSFNKLRFCYE